MREYKEIISMLYQDLTKEEQTQLSFALNRQFENLKNLYLESVERSIKTLFLLNAGGVVTVLAYLFKLSHSCSKSLLILSLIAFIIGLLLALLVVVLDFRNADSSFTYYSSNMDKYFVSTISYQELNQFKLINKKYIVNLGYVSGVCIPFGVLFGLIGYLI